MPQELKYLGGLLFSGGCAVMDLRSFKIRNFWLYGWAAGGFICRAAAGASASEGLYGLLFPLLLLCPFYLLRMMGAGDLKMFSALGIWMGLQEVQSCMVHAFLIAGGMALVSMVMHKNARARFAYLASYIRRLVRFGVRTSYIDEKNRKAWLPLSVPVLAAVTMMTLEGLL